MSHATEAFGPQSKAAKNAKLTQALAGADPIQATKGYSKYEKALEVRLRDPSNI